MTDDDGVGSYANGKNKYLHCFQTILVHSHQLLKGKWRSFFWFVGQPSMA